MTFYNSNRLLAKKLFNFMPAITLSRCSSLHFYLYLLVFILLLSHSAQAAVLVKNKMWPKGMLLHVVFLDGTNAQKTSVKQYAPLWLKETNLKFKFFDGFEKGLKQSHIRISFSSHDGSKLGNHGDYSSKDPTMLLNELNQPDLVEKAKRRLILHEFGHALGFEHEYRNPNWPFGQKAITQQIKDCIPRIQKIGYTLDEAHQKCVELNSLLDKKLVYSTIYDEFSIMNYPQKIQLKDNTYKQISAKSELSLLDQLAMQQWYGEIDMTNY